MEEKFFASTIEHLLADNDILTCVRSIKTSKRGAKYERTGDGANRSFSFVALTLMMKTEKKREAISALITPVWNTLLTAFRIDDNSTLGTISWWAPINKRNLRSASSSSTDILTTHDTFHKHDDVINSIYNQIVKFSNTSPSTVVDTPQSVVVIESDTEENIDHTYNTNDDNAIAAATLAHFPDSAFWSEFRNEYPSYPASNSKSPLSNMTP